MFSARRRPFCFGHIVLNAAEPLAALESINANLIIHPQSSSPTNTKSQNWDPGTRIMVFLEFDLEFDLEGQSQIIPVNQWGSQSKCFANVVHIWRS